MEYQLHLSPSRLTRILGLLLLLALSGHLFVVFAHFVLHWPVRAATELFDMDLEANLPTLVNVLLFFLAGALFHLAGRNEPKGARWQWGLLALAMVFLGFDEGSQIHEKLMLITLRLINHGQQTNVNMGWLYYAWVIPYGLGAVALLLVFARFFLRLPGPTRTGLVISGAVYVFGAVFCEMWSGKVAEQMEGIAWTSERTAHIPCEVYPDLCALYQSASYVAIYTLEETMEMLGLILCIRALAGHLARARTTARVEYTA